MIANNPYTNLRVEFHILQSFPVTCLNRDDVGAPKTAIVGGVQRARVSSQCWKRQVRTSLHDFGITLGVRTKKVAEMVAVELFDLGASEAQAELCSKIIADSLTKDTLHFFTLTEAKAFAVFAKEKKFDLTAKDDKEIQKVSKNAFTPHVDGIDIALFGRMVAQAADLNVQAAASFSHAISTHKVINEVEFFTALDDHQTEPGSAHMGSLEFNSATYYRYVNLDIGQLWETLSGEELIKAIDAFIKALYVAVPSARQTTQSGASPWEFAKVLVRKGQALQVPFEKPVVKEKDGGFLENSKKELCEYLEKKEKLAGSLFQKVDSFEWGNNVEYSIDSLISDIQKAIEKGKI